MDKVIFSDLSIYIVTSLALVNTVNSTPKFITEFIKKPVVANVITFTAVYLITKNIRLAIIYTAMMFVINNTVHENFQEFEIQPGCHDATVSDLLSLYDNDPVKLRKAIYLLGVPLSVDISEENAPYIASFIIGNGTQVTKDCPTDQPDYSCAF